MAAGIILAVLAVIALIVLFIWLSLRAAKKRRLAMEALATQMGWTLRRNDLQLTRHLKMEPFNFGSRRKADWIFEGNAGAPFTAFQYQCETQSNDSKGHTETDTHFYRVCIVEMPFDGKGLRITREHIGHKIWDTFGGEDIDFESDEFSRKYWVKCDDRKFAYDIIHPAMMEFLLPHGAWMWQWHGRQLVLHQSGYLQPKHVKPMVQLALGFHQNLPRHLNR